LAPPTTPRTRIQETLLAAWRGPGGFEGRASVRTWLYRIATSRCLNALRASSRRVAMDGPRSWPDPPGEWHAPIHPDVTRVRNTGFLFEGRVFHPGDAYTDPHAPVALLFVPEFGLFTKFGHAIDFIRQVKPKQASPVHDTGLDAQGLAGADGFLIQDRTPPFAPGTGSPFVRLPKGTPVNV
jgi:hypothetical protein